MKQEVFQTAVVLYGIANECSMFSVSKCADTSSQHVDLPAQLTNNFARFPQVSGTSNLLGTFWADLS